METGTEKGLGTGLRKIGLGTILRQGLGWGKRARGAIRDRTRGWLGNGLGKGLRKGLRARAMRRTRERTRERTTEKIGDKD